MHKELFNIDTPSVLVKLNILEQNIKEMADFAKNQKIALRPHIKSHKCPEIALLQIENGAKGIAVSKLDEAFAMIEAGIKDIQITYQIIGEQKISRLLKLMERAKISVCVDSIFGAKELSNAMAENGRELSVLIEVDTGLRRCGIKPMEKTLKFAKKIQKFPNLVLEGIMTHAGHVYKAKNYDEVQKIGKLEGKMMTETANSRKKNGIEIENVSVGTTPTAKIAGKIDGVTEIRPGNYVFNDNTQINLGVAKIENCSLSVLATVISTPTKKRAVIDAGSKTFGLDKGVHGTNQIKGFGRVLGKDVLIERLSEEHGILKTNEKLKIGEKIRIIPNHACTVINLFDEVIGVRDDKIENVLKVRARGCVK